MKSEHVFLLSIPLLMFAAPSVRASVPDLDLSSATTLAPVATTVFALPNGEGNPFTEARTPIGVTVDATVHLVLVDQFEVPVPNFPAEDLWLEPTGSWWGFSMCQNGTIADAPTDVNGETQWQQPLRAGGCTMGSAMVVEVAGVPLNQPGFYLFWNSADANGDGVVDLADLTPFSTAFYAGYHPCFDLLRDGHVNLGDVTQFARGFGAGCF